MLATLTYTIKGYNTEKGLENFQLKHPEIYKELMEGKISIDDNTRGYLAKLGVEPKDETKPEGLETRLQLKTKDFEKFVFNLGNTNICTFVEKMHIKV